MTIFRQYCFANTAFRHSTYYYVTNYLVAKGLLIDYGECSVNDDYGTTTQIAVAIVDGKRQFKSYNRQSTYYYARLNVEVKVPEFGVTVKFVSPEVREARVAITASAATDEAHDNFISACVEHHRVTNSGLGKMMCLNGRAWNAWKMTSRATLDTIIWSADNKKRLDKIFAQFQDGFPLIRNGSKKFVALLKGPPGTGKTLAAVAFAHSAGVPLYSIGPQTSDPAKLAALIGEMRIALSNLNNENPYVIVIDEIDRHLAHVSHQDADETATVFWHQFLDGHMNSNCVIFLTTNNDSVLDDKSTPLGRRVDARFTVDYPDYKGVAAALRQYELGDIARRVCAKSDVVVPTIRLSMCELTHFIEHDLLMRDDATKDEMVAAVDEFLKPYDMFLCDDK